MDGGSIKRNNVFFGYSIKEGLQVDGNPRAVINRSLCKFDFNTEKKEKKKKCQKNVCKWRFIYKFDDGRRLSVFGRNVEWTFHQSKKWLSFDKVKRLEGEGESDRQWCHVEKLIKWSSEERQSKCWLIVYGSFEKIAMNWNERAFVEKTWFGFEVIKTSLNIFGFFFNCVLEYFLDLLDSSKLFRFLKL